MYFSSDHAIAARNEAMSNAHLASSIVIESLEKMLGLYASTGKTALALVEEHSQRGASEGGKTLWHVLAERHGAEFLAEYLQITGQTREKFRKVFEAQFASTSKLAISALERASDSLHPPTQEVAEAVMNKQAEKAVGTETSSASKEPARSKRGN